MQAKGNLIVVSGPSGVGKGTICKKIVDLNKNLLISVSSTTRAPRDGEVEGKDYFFLSQEEFKNKIEENSFLEYSHHFGNYYGTPVKPVQEALERGEDVLLEIDVNGAEIVKKNAPDAVFVFVLPPSLKELKTRIENRGSESEEAILKRIHRAVTELKHIDIYDYCIVNDNLEAAIQSLNLIIKIARLKPSKYIGLLGDIRKDLENL